MLAAWRVRPRWERPLAGDAFPAPPPPRVDGRLVAGAAPFGVGWGASGFCPGPLLVSRGAGVPSAAILVPAMLAGMLLHQLIAQRRRSSSAETGDRSS